jgi:nitroimidazol reductase NimA-like FMN-containing flavoprotein (pyridoxamine 5'-phosphate oxidase superfamily)
LPPSPSQLPVPEPAAGRPWMPDYGISPATDGLLPWAWAVERLERAHNYWVATTGPGGSPHLAAVWGLWHGGAFVFSTGGRSRKARNLAADPRCVVTPEHAGESVVVEGTAGRVTDPAALAALLAAYQGKYGSGFPDPGEHPVFAVRPRVAFAVVEREPMFSSSATRWVFGTPPA